MRRRRDCRCLVICYVRFISQMKCVFVFLFSSFCASFDKIASRCFYSYFGAVTLSSLHFHSWFGVIFKCETFFFFLFFSRHLPSDGRRSRTYYNQLQQTVFCFVFWCQFAICDEYESCTRDHRDTLIIVHGEMKIKTKYSQPFRYHAFYCVWNIFFYQRPSMTIVCVRVTLLLFCWGEWISGFGIFSNAAILKCCFGTKVSSLVINL